MYEYKFVKVELRGTLRLEAKADCQIIEDEYGQLGWRLLQILVPPNISSGIATYYELIFEREI